MDNSQAQRAIESLRKGIPPDGLVRDFTVGRKAEINELVEHLSGKKGSALLLNANYGSGKTHLLRFIREEALAQNYAVSSVTLDANSAVRFNRMDQMFGAICRGMEIPQAAGTKGLRAFLGYLTAFATQHSPSSFWRKLSNDGKWDYSEILDSPALYVALRAWSTGDNDAADLVENWLYQPWEYRALRQLLHLQLVANLRQYFRDPRPDGSFFADGVFEFHTQGYAQSWAALRDFDRLVREAGLKGLVILFDEFEDVITNLRNVGHQEAAFWNLFVFYSGKQFPGRTFYAVTPEFVVKCKGRLLEKGRWDFDLARFDSLPSFEMSPLGFRHLMKLAKLIVPVHAQAYGWDAGTALAESNLQEVIEQATQSQVQDRTRQAIIAIVGTLDDCLQSSA